MEIDWLKLVLAAPSSEFRWEGDLMKASPGSVGILSGGAPEGGCLWVQMLAETCAGLSVGLRVDDGARVLCSEPQPCT
ncbi:hypothetical protein ABT150_48065 [Streptomyces mirabilis]|uniref:hypothetical protein n=1 Tax=Streptomyces mirabilis TaxID=68239 RepID=UPI00332D935C